MKLQSYEPLAVLCGFQRELDRLWPEYRRQDAEEDSHALSNWSPAVDIQEEPERFVIRADIPGVDPKQIDITTEGNVLTLRGVRTEVKEDKSPEYIRTERYQGSFSRRFSLPDSANVKRIEARSNHGVLEIFLPKEEKVQPRRIEVQG